ncbi:MAG: flagellar basal body rod protein FlgB [Mariprofundales bacterium]
MSTGLFSGTFSRLESAITAREATQKVVSGNIANADTPNYKADRRTFADFLDATRQAQQPVAMHATNSRHMDVQSSSRPLDLGGVFHRQQDGLQRMDGNTVDTQQEMVTMAENQLMHDLSIKLIKGKLSGLQRIIRETR